MDEKHISIQKSARYFTQGEPNFLVKNVWICLHGYGQLVRYFSRNFAALQQPERYFVFPEGPHKFYLAGTNGRVGASWMTKEDRLTDIADQFAFLEPLAKQIVGQFKQPVRLHVLGFSQGVATALRWLSQSEIDAQTCVCWAGSFPPDIDYKLQRNKFATMRMHACFGDDDAYISEADAQNLLAQMHEQNIEITPHFYAGKHKIYPDLLADIMQQCEA